MGRLSLTVFALPSLMRKLKSKRVFELPLSEKEKLSPTSRSFDQGYFGIGKERIRGQTAMKENFDFGDSASSWPEEEQLPGFRGFAEDFHQVCQHSGNGCSGSQ